MLILLSKIQTSCTICKQHVPHFSTSTSTSISQIKTTKEILTN